MNLRETAEQLGLEITEIIEAAEAFLAMSRMDIETIRNGLEKNDLPAAARAAHSIKGAAATFGFERIYRATLEVESAVRRGEKASCLPAVEEIAMELELLARELDSNRKRQHGETGRK